MCPTCGTKRVPDAPGMLCPVCLMRLGLPDEERAVPFDLPESPASRTGEDGGPPPTRGTTIHRPTIIDIGDPEAAEPDATDLLVPGTRLLLLGEIARGGVGVIFLGHDKALGRQLAVKVLQQQHRDRPAMVRNFVEEARIAGQLQHPGIVPVYEFGTLADHRPYFAMKLVKGRTLAEALASRSAPADHFEHLLAMFLQMTHAVAYAHDHGVIHLDLKPSNVMLGKHGEVQVMDWGLARVLDRNIDGEAASGLPAAGDHDGKFAIDAGSNRRLAGTPGYMAPEQFESRTNDLDERTDVFALGAILHEILTGRPVYEGRDVNQVRYRAATADLTTALESLRTCGADEGLISLAIECLAVDREARPRNAGMVAARLTAHLEGMQQRLHAAELERAQARARVTEERKRRRLTIILALVATALATLGVITYAQWSRQRQERQARALRVLEEVQKISDEAASDPTGDPHKWQLTVDASRRSEILLADASPAARQRLSILAGQGDRGLQKARTDREVLERLEIARFRADQWDLAGAATQFESAFRDAGLDIRHIDPGTAGIAIAARPRDVRDAMVAALDCWTILSRSPYVQPAARTVAWKTILATARAADRDPWRDELRRAMETDNRAAIMRLARSDEIEKQSAPSLWLTGRLLFWSGQVNPAIAVLRRAWRIYPDDFWINLDLAMLLTFNKPRYDVALSYATSAVALRPNSAVAHLRRANIQEMRNNPVDSEAEFRAALALRPDNSLAHFEYALVLFSRERNAEAVEEYRKAMLTAPDRAQPVRSLVSEPLIQLRRLDEAVAVLEEATRIDPSNLSLWLQLARARIAARQGNKAAEALKQAEKLARPNAPDAGRIATVRSSLTKLERLPALLRGESPPRDNAERLAFARFCGEVGFAAAGARLYAAAIAADPAIVDNRSLRPREQGARLAALAGCGRSDDAPATESERSQLRRQALEWLRAEMANMNRPLPGSPAPSAQLIASRMGHWMNAHELAGVRDNQALASLPKDEQDAWKAFWQDTAKRAPADSD